MHVIMLSSDRTVFEPGSPARKRMEEYARAFGKLSVIVFAKRSLSLSPEIGVALSLYPTGSFSRFSYMRDAVRIASGIRGAAVVSAQDPFESGIAGMRIARRLKIPLHVQVHTDFLVPEFARAHWPLNLLRLGMARRVLKRAARIRAVSTRIKEHIEARYRPAAPVSVLPIYTDVSLFSNIAPMRHPKFPIALLVVSRLEKEKRVDMALFALKMVRDEGITAGLDVVGSGSEEAALRRLARTLGIDAFVEFHGFQKDLTPYYAQADALLYPGAAYEGFGMAIVEALAAHVPVVAFDVGIAREAGAEIAAGETARDFGMAVAAFLKKPPVSRADLVPYRPYASMDEYLARLKADLTIPR
jgi:glycosyltransferase involved in cell wall biosynthesis